jgi:hypothetical protein
MFHETGDVNVNVNVNITWDLHVELSSEISGHADEISS